MCKIFRRSKGQKDLLRVLDFFFYFFFRNASPDLVPCHPLTSKREMTMLLGSNMEISPTPLSTLSPCDIPSPKYC